MRAFDLLRLILDNLGRRKARVGLTAVGVVIGSAAVVVLVSLAAGLQRNATEQLGSISDLTRIEVYPGYNFATFGGGGGGGMVAVEVGGGPGQPAGQVLITDQSLVDFAALPGVTEVYPRDMAMGQLVLKYQGMESYNMIFGVPPEYLTALNPGMEPGSLRPGRGEGGAGGGPRRGGRGQRDDHLPRVSGQHADVLCPGDQQLLHHPAGDLRRRGSDRLDRRRDRDRQHDGDVDPRTHPRDRADESRRGHQSRRSGDLPGRGCGYRLPGRARRRRPRGGRRPAAQAS